MANIVDRLRSWGRGEEDCQEGADEIERLRAEVERLNSRLSEADAEVERLRSVLLDDIPCDGEPDQDSDECDHCMWQHDGMCLVTAQPAALAENDDPS